MCAENGQNGLDCQQKIGHTSLTIEWLLLSLGETCPEFQRLSKESPVSKVDIKQIGLYSGHNSTIYKIEITFAEKGSLVVCLKTLPTLKEDELFGMKRPFGPEHRLLVHNQECKFYESFRNANSGIRLPETYSIRKMDSLDNDKEAHILMEFLGPSADIIPLGQSYTRAQLEAAFDQVARLHAYSFVNRAQLEKEFDRSLIRKDPNRRAQWDENQEKFLQHLEGHDGAEVVALLRDLNDRFNQHDFMHWVNSICHEKFGVPSVLLHGDFWGNNVVFEQDSENGFTSRIRGIIDWQFAIFGNPAQDLSRLLIMNTSAELRRQIQDAMLEHYHKRLHSHLKSLGNESKIFSLDQLKCLFAASFTCQIHFATFIGAASFERNKSRIKERREYLRQVKEAAVDAQSFVNKYGADWLTEV